MLCFPAVLFAGAVLPVATMDVGGRAVSVAVIARWSFEAVGHDLGLPSLLARDAVGAPLLSRFDGAFDHATVGSWVLLSGFAAVQLLATWEVLRRRTRP
jgi:hypothetical protein